LPLSEKQGVGSSILPLASNKHWRFQRHHLTETQTVSKTGS